jgi:anti-anti-sigma factor
VPTADVPSVAVEQVKSTAVVFPDRVLDCCSGATMVETTTVLVGRGVTELAVDCADVTFIDCAGVTALLDVSALLRTVAGAAFLVDVPARMRYLLDILNVDLTVKTFDARVAGEPPQEDLKANELR